MYLDLPLAMHRNARTAAEAAQCAADAGKFWEYHDKIFQNQRALDADNLKKYASDLGLDAKEFGSCLDSGKHSARVRLDEGKAQQLGITGTPAFLVNGRYISGAQPFEVFKAIIDDELQRKGIALPTGS